MEYLKIVCIVGFFIGGLGAIAIGVHHILELFPSKPKVYYEYCKFCEEYKGWNSDTRGCLNPKKSVKHPAKDTPLARIEAWSEAPLIKYTNKNNNCKYFEKE